jgi:hypothetical protein
VLSNIEPPRLRREASLFRELKSYWSHVRSLLFDQPQVVPPIRLRSRSVIWTIDPGPLQDGYRIVDHWRESWLSNVPVNGDIVDDPSVVPAGFELNRREWVILNRFAAHKASVRIWCIDGATVTRRLCSAENNSYSWLPTERLRPFEGGLTLTVLHQVLSEVVVYLTN